MMIRQSIVSGLRRGVALASILAVTAVAAAGCGSSPRFFGGGGGGIGGGMKVLAFYAPGSAGGSLNSAARKLVADNRAHILAFTPLWYHVENNGAVKSTMNKSLAAFIHKERIPLIPLVNNAKGATKFLVDAKARTTAVNALVRIVDTNRYQGIHIDFELLKPADKQGLDAFMKDLYGQLHKKGKRVAIDVIPQAHVGQSGGQYDYRTLARYADAVILMAYDEHSDSSAPGPVAALPWVKQRLSVALRSGIPPGKLELGIADYGYDWTVTSSGTHKKGTQTPTYGVAEIQAKKLGEAQIQSQGHVPKRDQYGDPHFTYSKGGQQHVVWYEDQQSVIAKVKLAKEKKLHAVALWRVGYENAAYWKALDQALK